MLGIPRPSTRIRRIAIHELFLETESPCSPGIVIGVLLAFAAVLVAACWLVRSQCEVALGLEGENRNVLNGNEQSVAKINFFTRSECRLRYRPRQLLCPVDAAMSPWSTQSSPQPTTTGAPKTCEGRRLSALRKTENALHAARDAGFSHDINDELAPQGRTRRQKLLHHKPVWERGCARRSYAQSRAWLRNSTPTIPRSRETCHADSRRLGSRHSRQNCVSEHSDGQSVRRMVSQRYTCWKYRKCSAAR